MTDTTYVVATTKEEHWVLPVSAKGYAVARTVTKILEMLPPGSGWTIYTVGSLQELNGIIRWIYSDSKDFEALFT